MNIKGIDVSNNNGTIDFSEMVNDNVEIVYLKATEGKSFKDNTMGTFYKDCKANGLKVGAYHFLVGTSSPEDQAQNFYEMIKDYDWDCIPMMDVETNFSGLSNYVERFIIEFKKISDLKLGIYSYTSFICYLKDAEDMIKDMPFWEANYNNDPWNLSDTFFTNRIGHQYTEKGVITGITSEGCDVDSFTEGVFLRKLGWNKNETGWWYCTNLDMGYYYRDVWRLIDGDWYSFDLDGYARQTTWLQDGGKWYWIQDDCRMAKSKWVWIDGECYCFDTHGVCYIDCVTPDGYTVDNSGAWDETIPQKK